MKRLRYILEYALVRLPAAVLASLPRSWALPIGASLGGGLSIFLRGRRRLVDENLRHAFPSMTTVERRRIARSVWRNTGRVAVEFVRMGDIRRDNHATFFRFEGLEYCRQALSAGRGMIFIGIHFANWEATGVGCQLALGNVVAIARPVKNPYVETWVRSLRRQSGVNTILHRSAVKASLRVLKAGNVIAVLVDQNLYTGGVFVDFFGRPCATTTLPALLHARTGAPVVLAYVLREGRGFRVIYEPVSLPPAIDDMQEQILRDTQMIAAKTEDVIRRHPESWFWLHNRWKRQPGPLDLSTASPHVFIQETA